MSIKDSSKLFCGNINDSVCEADVAELFRSYGFEAEDVALPADPMTGRGRGFGFVVLGSPAEARQAEMRMQGVRLEGRTLRINQG